jgi:hypothetical protein
VTVLKDTMNSVLSSNFIITILISGSLENLWGVVRAMQMIVFVNMVNVWTPVHFNLFFTGAVIISSMDILGMEDKYGEWFEFA